MKRPEDILGNDNYYHWEFNMRMTLARKGLLGHIECTKKEAEVTEEWRRRRMPLLRKAFKLSTSPRSDKHARQSNYKTHYASSTTSKAGAAPPRIQDGRRR